MKLIIYLSIFNLILFSCKKETQTTYSFKSNLPITIFNCRTLTADQICRTCFENAKILDEFGTLNPESKTKTVSTKVTKLYFSYTFIAEDTNQIYILVNAFFLQENTYNDLILDPYSEITGPFPLSFFDK